MVEVPKVVYIIMIILALLGVIWLIFSLASFITMMVDTHIDTKTALRMCDENGKDIARLQDDFARLLTAIEEGLKSNTDIKKADERNNGHDAEQSNNT